MKQIYIGTKQITASPSLNAKASPNGEPGYTVQYPDGYTSWSPAHTFESSYLPMGKDNDGSKVTEQMVADFIADWETKTVGQCTTVVVATLVNGYEITESSACVDPANYDEEYGGRLAREKVKSKVWELLGFLLQCARFGVKDSAPKRNEEF